MKKSITEICELIRGVTFSKGDAKTSIQNSYMPVFRSNNIQDGRLIFDDLIYIEQDKVKEKQILKIGDVVITASTGSKLVIGKAAQLATKWTGSFGAFCIVLRPKTDLVDPCFFGYYFQTPDYRKAISHMSSGANINNLKKSYFDELKIEVPSFEDQKRIVCELDVADALRQKRKQAIALLDDYLKAVFLEMFGDPVMNPKGWEKLPILNIAIKITDGEHLNPQFENEGMPMVMAGNVLQNTVDINAAKRVNIEKGQLFRKKCNPEKSDILLVSRGATIGRLCKVDTTEPFCLMGSVILIKPEGNLINPIFLTMQLKHPSMYNKLFNSSGSSAQQAIYLKDVKKLVCILPPLALQNQFAAIVEKVDSLKQTMFTQSDKLETNFNALMQTAFKS